MNSGHPRLGVLGHFLALIFQFLSETGKVPPLFSALTLSIWDPHVQTTSLGVLASVSLSLCFRDTALEALVQAPEADGSTGTQVPLTPAYA